MFLAPEPAADRIRLGQVAADEHRHHPAPDAGHQPLAVLGGGRGERRATVAAALDLLRAAPGERATGGDLGRVGRVAPDTPEILDRRQRGAGVEQRPGVGVAGAIEHEAGRADLGQPAPVHDGHPVGQHLERVGVVAHDDQRPPRLPPEAGEDLEHPVAGGRVEAGGRLVEDEDLGIADQCEGEEHQAALAAGQLPGIALQGPPAQTHGVEDFGAAAVGRLAAPAEVNLLGLGQLQPYPQDGVERRSGLHGHGDPPPPDLPPPVLVECGEVDVVEADAALDGRRAGQPQDAATQGGFPRSRLAEDAEALAAGDGQREVVDGPDGRRPGIGDPEPVDGQRRAHGVCRLSRGLIRCSRPTPTNVTPSSSRLIAATGGTSHHFQASV